MNERRFRNRAEAGKMLAERLRTYSNRPDVLALALPRGGVPVAFEIARSLHVPLDVLIIRKLGVPGQEELAMGAIASGGIRVINNDVVQILALPPAVIDEVTAREQREMERRERLYRGNRPAYHIQGRVVILVDDGIATGSTMLAAIAAVKQRQPARVIIAVPVVAAGSCAEFAGKVDELVCISKPENFFAVSLWYDYFPQTTDQEVRDLLARAIRERKEHQASITKTT